MLTDQSKLEKLYESVILGEMRQSHIDEISPDRSSTELPFNDLFKGKLRMLISFGESDIFNNMVNDLKNGTSIQKNIYEDFKRRLSRSV